MKMALMSGGSYTGGRELVWWGRGGRWGFLTDTGVDPGVHPVDL